QIVNEHRNCEIQSKRTSTRYLRTFCQSPRLRIQHIVMLITLDEPLIRRMRFTNVNNQERHLITKTLVEVFKLPSLGPEGGSGKAPKDQSDRFVVTERGESHALVTAELWQGKVWCLSPDRRGMGLPPGEEGQPSCAPLWVHATDEGQQSLPVCRRK